MSKTAARLRPTGDTAQESRTTQVTEGSPMKYMLMMHTPSGGPYQIATWPKSDLMRHIEFMKAFARKLGAAGELVGAEGLAGPDQAKRVRAGKDGKPITDGVF